VVGDLHDKRPAVTAPLDVHLLGLTLGGLRRLNRCLLLFGRLLRHLLPRQL
jgi:hypothetical protein